MMGHDMIWIALIAVFLYFVYVRLDAYYAVEERKYDDRFFTLAEKLLELPEDHEERKFALSLMRSIDVNQAWKVLRLITKLLLSDIGHIRSGRVPEAFKIDPQKLSSVEAISLEMSYCWANSQVCRSVFTALAFRLAIGAVVLVFMYRPIALRHTRQDSAKKEIVVEAVESIASTECLKAAA